MIALKSAKSFLHILTSLLLFIGIAIVTAFNGCSGFNAVNSKGKLDVESQSETDQTVTVKFIQDNEEFEKTVQYDVIDGNAVIDGDIILGTEEEIKISSPMFYLPSVSDGSLETSVNQLFSETTYSVSPYSIKLWNKGIIPFSFHEKLPNSLKLSAQKAMNEISSKTKIIFSQRTNEESYLFFQPSNYLCSSSVGRVGGKQSVYLSIQCDSSDITHELMHALGFLHETSREDRDKYIKINFENISSFSMHYLDKNPGRIRGEYDIDSIMHFSSYYFSNNNEPTITDINGNLIPEHTSLSRGDIEGINERYQVEVSKRDNPIAPQNNNPPEFVGAIQYDSKGIVYGCVVDPDSKNQPLDMSVEFGNVGYGEVFDFKADVKDSFRGCYRFKYLVPLKYLKGQKIRVSVFAKDNESRLYPMLLSTGIRYFEPSIENSNQELPRVEIFQPIDDPLPQAGNAVPTFEIGAFHNSGLIYGWVFDPDQPTKSLNLYFEVDGINAGNTIANISNEMVNSRYRITGNHVFNFKIPAAFLNGKIRNVKIYSQDFDKSGVEIKTLVHSVNHQLGGNSAPTGWVDSVSSSGVVSGWAFDPDSLSVFSTVFIQVDGKDVGQVSVTLPSPDINKLFSIVGNHKFSFQFPDKFKDGLEHNVSVYVLDVSPVNITLTKRNNESLGGVSKFKLAPIVNNVVNDQTQSPITNDNAPIANTPPPSGSVVNDQVQAPIATNIAPVLEIGAFHNSGLIYGWAYDPDQAAKSIEVYFEVDGQYAGQAFANIFNSTVNSRYGISGNHVFNFKIPYGFLTGKTRTVKIFVQDYNSKAVATKTLVKTINHQLGGNSAPTGWIDSISGSGQVTGWALDPDSTSSSVRLYVQFDNNGQVVGNTTANLARSDINTMFSITGNHKFVYQIPDKYKDGNEHTITIIAMDLDRSYNENTILGGVTKFKLAPVSQPPTSSNTDQAFDPSSPVVITSPANNESFVSLNPTVTWKYNNNVGSHYWVDVSTDPGFKWFWNKKYSISSRSLVINSPSTWGKSASAPTAMPASLNYNTKYYIRIVPFDGANRLGSFSGSSSFTTKLDR